MRWIRAKDGAIFGVCKGLAKALNMPVGMFRLFWLVSVLFFGVGLGLYLVLAISLPREDKVVEALDPRILGVCTRIARDTQLEVGIVRFLAVCSAIAFLGTTVVVYIVLYFVMDKHPTQSSDSRPSTPPATT